MSPMQASASTDPLMTIGVVAGRDTSIASYHLAQVNVSRLRAPIDSRRLRGFVLNHDRVNAAAKAAPGFVWRLEQDVHADGLASASEWDADASFGVVVNLSVWRDVEALESYTYGRAHGAMLARRREWFQQMPEAHLALWWIAAGTTPTTSEALARIRHLRAHGPTPHAFTLHTRFPAPETR